MTDADHLVADSPAHPVVAYDVPPDESIAQGVVTAVAAAAGASPIATSTDERTLTPLYDAIDPDALDALVRRSTAGSVAFTYEGFEVTVDADGFITVT